MESNQPSTCQQPSTIVVVAKSPRPGSSKTRLVPLLGDEGAALLARHMLADVLTAVSDCNELMLVPKVLLYAPPTEDGLATMEALLREFSIAQTHEDSSGWTLRPVPTDAPSLHSSKLSSILVDALMATRKQMLSSAHSSGTVIFLGMDSPEIPMSELIAACSRTSSSTTDALLCPAADGGYGLIAVPPNAHPQATFNPVQWSHPLTAMSQLKALTDQSLRVTIGPVMHDVDEPSDVHDLCERLRQSHATMEPSAFSTSPVASCECLKKPSLWVSEHTNECKQESNANLWTGATKPTILWSSCRCTRDALVELGQLDGLVEAVPPR